MEFIVFWLSLALVRASSGFAVGCAAMNNHLKELRALRGWSQAYLAEQLEVSRQSVNAIETGRYDPSLPLAFRIAKIFALPIEQIFEDQA